MNSGGHRGFTAVTVVTLIFAPIFSHHHWMWKLVGQTEQTQIVQCAVKTPCPKKKRIVNVVKAGEPAPQPRSKQDDNSAVDDPTVVAKTYAGSDR